MYFPSLCIDNFYERPDEVRDIAESMVYKRKTQENFWPGKRTENIGEIDKSLHHETCTKILSIFYPFQLENFRAIQFSSLCISLVKDFLEPYNLEHLVFFKK